jgi:hypothetical protein
MTSSWRADKNSKALGRLQRALPAVFPIPVLQHALSRPFIPPTPRLAVDSYWREHPVRADRLARRMAAQSGAPTGWAWRLGTTKAEGLPATFRVPPAPYREAAYSLGPGRCCVCGRPVFRYGWHVDLWQDGKANRNASWHTSCVVAWKLWTAPRAYLRPLRRLQGRLCPETGKRLLRTGEVDHRVPLHRVWREHRDLAWPELLSFWGVRNLQVINRDGHASKSAVEARHRDRLRGNGLSTEQS